MHLTRNEACTLGIRHIFSPLSMHSQMIRRKRFTSASVTIWFKNQTYLQIALSKFYLESRLTFQNLSQPWQVFRE